MDSGITLKKKSNAEIIIDLVTYFRVIFRVLSLIKYQVNKPTGTRSM